MIVVFTMGSQRSGTRYLSDVFARNAKDCTARHETLFEPANPSMFGRPIYDRATGDVDAVRSLLERKRRAIERHGTRCYVETSNAFMLSAYDLAPEVFTDLRLIHLLRDPLKVARSSLNRYRLAERWRLPGRHYRAPDGRRYFRWSLTGREPIFARTPGIEAHSLAWYALHWIEIENRICRFSDAFGLRERTFTLQAPDDLVDGERLASMFDFLGLERQHPHIAAGRRRNRNPGRPTEVTADDRRVFAETIAQVPPEYLAIFESEPYLGRDWSAPLRA
ncbi:MAG: hypothetical protein PVG27_09675 [Chloroflexota bacterium]|jgi:hypothetical protein